MYLVKNEVSSPLDGDSEDVIEAIRDLADQLIPSSVIVSFSGQTLYLHSIDEIICAEDVVLFLRIFATEVGGPVGFSSTRKPNHHQNLELPT